MKKFVISFIAVAVLAMSSSGCYRRPYYGPGYYHPYYHPYVPVVRGEVIVR